MNGVTISNHGDLFCVPCGRGYTCLGFDVCMDWTRRIAEEIGQLGTLTTPPRGTLESYAEYERVIAAAHDYHKRTGRRLAVHLTPQLNGLEGKRVEVVDCYGEQRRFLVGKSTGWMPCHIELKSRRSSGGGSVTGAPFKSLRVVS